MNRLSTKWAIGALTITLLSGGGEAYAKDKLTFSTNWLAQAEHGGFYQAISEGIYDSYDLDVTLNWKPETELDVVATEGDVGSHALMGAVRVVPAGESWPVGKVKSILNDG